MPRNLFDDLDERGWHASLLTTYTVDPTFYDTCIEPRLRSRGCTNNILIVDRSRLTQSLQNDPGGFRHAGTLYAVVPAQVNGSFHPKLHLQLGRDKARVFVGSANATSAGWKRNLEIITCLDWAVSGTNAEIGPLIRKAYDYITHWFDEKSETLTYMRALHRRNSPWLDALAQNTAPIELRDGSAIDLWCEHAGDEPSLLSRLLNRVADERVERVAIVSPYWDTRLDALREIRAAYPDAEITVALNPGTSKFPIGEVHDEDRLIFASAFPAETKRFLHAKLFVIGTKESDHVLFGSANCSDDALGGGMLPSRNAEACVYRRLAPGTALALLGLELQQLADPSVITAAPTPSRDDVTVLAAAGLVETVKGRLLWWPPAERDPQHAELLVGEQTLSLQPQDDAVWAPLPAGLPNPIVARIRYADGSVSVPVIVHDHDKLRGAAREGVSRPFASAFNQLADGDIDFVDLAGLAILLFPPDGNEAVGHARLRGPPRRGNGRTDDVPDEADELKAPKQAGDADFAELWNLIRRSIGAAEDRASGLAALTDDDDLDSGETEDGELEEGQKEDGDGHANTPEPANDVGQKLRASKKRNRIRRRPTNLQRSVKRFDRSLKAMRMGEAPVTWRLAPQACFLIELLMRACAMTDEDADGNEVPLRTLAPERPNDERAIAVPLGRILQYVWSRHGTTTPLAHRLREPDVQGVTDEHLAVLSAKSRWAIVRIYLACKAKPDQLLFPIVRALMVELFASSEALGPFDVHQELAWITRIDRVIAPEAGEIDRLLALFRQLRPDGDPHLGDRHPT